MRKFFIFIGCLFIVFGVINHISAFSTDNNYYITQQTARIILAVGFYNAGIICIGFGCILDALEKLKAKPESKPKEKVMENQKDTSEETEASSSQTVITKEDINNTTITPDWESLKSLTTLKDIELAKIIVKRAHMAGDLTMGDYVERRDFLAKKSEEL